MIFDQFTITVAYLWNRLNRVSCLSPFCFIHLFTQSYSGTIKSKMDIERRSAVKSNKGNQAHSTNQPSGSGSQSATDQPDSILVFNEITIEKTELN